MKRIFFYSLIFLGWSTSCAPPEKAMPNFIERDKMVEVISEIELTQALIKLTFSNKDTINSQALYDQVYERFNISEEQFNNSLVFYCKSPKEAEGIYIDAIALLSAKQAQKK